MQIHIEGNACQWSVRFSLSLCFKGSGYIYTWQNQSKETHFFFLLWGGGVLPRDIWLIEKNITLNQQHLTPTRPKVNSGIDFFYRATLDVANTRSICGEEHHVVAQVRPEQLVKVTQVVVVTSEITAIFILHLTNIGAASGGCYLWVTCCNDTSCTTNLQESEQNSTLTCTVMIGPPFW